MYKTLYTYLSNEIPHSPYSVYNVLATWTLIILIKLSKILHIILFKYRILILMTNK